LDLLLLRSLQVIEKRSFGSFFRFCACHPIGRQVTSCGLFRRARRSSPWQGPASSCVGPPTSHSAIPIRPCDLTSCCLPRPVAGVAQLRQSCVNWALNCRRNPYTIGLASGSRARTVSAASQ